MITGAREGKRIVVKGEAAGVGAGSMLTPHAAPSLDCFTAGVPFAVRVDGEVSWSRRASTSVVWRVYVASGDLRSNTVRIR